MSKNDEKNLNSAMSTKYESTENSIRYPLVTYVIPCFNHQDFVGDAIRSLLKQTYEQIELIIIDDGSTDKSLCEIKKLKNDCEKRFIRFKIISRRNMGLVYSLNEGLRWARGDFFSMLASDDLLYPHKTQTMVDCLNAAGEHTAVAYGAMDVIDENGKIIRKFVGRPGFYNFKDVILKKCPYATPTQMVRIKPLRKIGGFNRNLRFEDWAMVLALAADGNKIFVCSDVVSQYRRHSNNISKMLIENHTYRLKVLDLYKSSAFYEKAKARVLSGHATEIATSNRSKALESLSNAVKTYPLILFDAKFKRGLLSTIKSYVRQLKW